MGDGHLELDRNNRSINARLIIRRAAKDKDYLLWEQSIFEEYCSDRCFREYDGYDEETGKAYPGLCLTTLSNPVLTPYHEKWYNSISNPPQNIKIVPRDLVLNPLVMLIWLLDDGCITRTNSGKLAIKLCSQCFTYDENLFLQSLLEYRYREKFSLVEIDNAAKDGTYHYIYGYGAPVDAIVRDIEDIYPYGIMSRKAIWTHAYDDSPHTYDIKRQKINEFMWDRDEFFTNELGRYAGFEFQRKSDKIIKGKKSSRKGRIEVATTTLKNQYLQKYIDQELMVKIGRITGSYNLGIKYKLTDLGKVYFSERSIIS